MSEFRVGDHVRLVFEGEVTRVWADDYPDDAGLDIDRETFDGTQISKAKVEKIEPPVEVFKPGDVVRDKDKPELIYALGADGYMRVGKGSSFCGGGWPHYDYGGEVFTSERYEKVNLS